MRLGSPALFWGVTAGATDSLVANYTATGRKRKSCDFTPGGDNCRRPDRSSIVYTNLIKRFSSEKKPVVLGGIEASLRRFSHYDLLSRDIRRPLLFDSKADWLIYGMGEYPALQLAEALRAGRDVHAIENLVYIAQEAPAGALVLPSHEEAASAPEIFQKFFRQFYAESSTLSRRVLAQKCGDRYVVQNPQHIMSTVELDHIHNLDYERAVHPYDLAKGEVRGAETARFSIATHRGCFGECSFCAISVHQGRRVLSRSEESVLEEARKMVSYPAFKGIISDVGGPTANMYGAECARMTSGQPCADKRCLFPKVCPTLNGAHKRYNALLDKLSRVKGIKKVLVASGIRCDMAVADRKEGAGFISRLACEHTGGQIKLAPEHTDEFVLRLMGKCPIDNFERFMEDFARESTKAAKKQFITCYFMAAHPGCNMSAMQRLKRFITGHLHFRPQQIQIFTPTPSTWSTCMYYTGLAPDGTPIYVARTEKEKAAQKEMLMPQKLGGNNALANKSSRNHRVGKRPKSKF